MAETVAAVTAVLLLTLVTMEIRTDTAMYFRNASMRGVIST